MNAQNPSGSCGNGLAWEYNPTTYVLTISYNGEGTGRMNKLTMGVKPTTPTGIEQITNDQSPKTKKFFRNGQLLIEKNGKIYNAIGIEVK